MNPCPPAHPTDAVNPDPTQAVPEAPRCPRCRARLPSGVLQGLCPACLLDEGLATEDGGTVGRRVDPPPVEVLAPLFPALEIGGLLGVGGMGAVYKARQPALDRWVALKVLPAGTEGVASPERFNREARALARLAHPHIVGVHEFGQVDGWHYFLMEYVEGANLRQLARSGNLSPREVLRIVPQICDALQYAHDQGVVHRDIKPENVLVDRAGRVKIADFGLAKILGPQTGASRLTVEGQVMGTPHYMAPEQVERPESVDHRADLYSLGVVLYEMLTGDLPLGRFPPPSKKVEVDVRLDAVVLRALENDPERRYQRASEIRTGVQAAAAGQPSDAADASYASDWRVRWFLTSPEAAAVYRNMTRGEKVMDFWIQAGGAGLSVLVLVAMVAAVQGIGGRPGWGFLAIWLGGLTMLGLLLWGAVFVLKRSLVSTQWARAHGLDPDRFRLFAWPPWLASGNPRPGDGWRRFGFLAACALLGAVSMGLGLTLTRFTRQAATRPQPVSVLQPGLPVAQSRDPVPVETDVAVSEGGVNWWQGTPRLEYLGWQPESGSTHEAVVWTPAGRRVTDRQELENLGRVHAPRLDPSQASRVSQGSPVLQLWFEHPDFDDGAEVELVVSEGGQGAVSESAGGFRHGVVLRQEASWTSSTGLSRRRWITGAVIVDVAGGWPGAADVVLRCAIGPLDDPRWLPGSFRRPATLAEGIEVSEAGPGQGPSSAAFLALTLSASAVDPGLRFGARALDRRGVWWWPSVLVTLPEATQAQRRRFEFKPSLGDIEGFEVGTRRVHRAFWPNVALLSRSGARVTGDTEPR